MCHQIGHWNQVGFRAKADFASGPAANDPQRLTRAVVERPVIRSPVRECEECYRQLEAERLGGPEIDRQPML
jgi:hypothetical protein